MNCGVLRLAMEFNMEHLHSRSIEAFTYETEGLCDGIPLRAHNHPRYEEIGALRAQEDWSRLVSPLKHYKGGLAPKYNFLQISIPECLPERLEIISYANEIAFLHDGMAIGLPCSSSTYVDPP